MVSATSLSGPLGPILIFPRPPQLSSFQHQWTFYLSVGLCSRPFPSSQNSLLSAHTLLWPHQPCAGFHLATVPSPLQANPPLPYCQIWPLPGTKPWVLFSIFGHLSIPTTYKYHLHANDHGFTMPAHIFPCEVQMHANTYLTHPPRCGIGVSNLVHLKHPSTKYGLAIQ